MHPLIKWPGGKARLVPQIEMAFRGPCKRYYLEPFLGSGSVYLGRSAAGTVRRAVLADANPRLINLHRVVLHQPQALLQGIVEAQANLGVWRERYAIEVRDFNRYLGVPPLGDVPLAVRMLWLNRTCFNGLYRENRKGNFNSPPGFGDHNLFPAPEHVETVSALLRSAMPLLLTADACAVLRAAGPGDQVYLDPPYIPLTSTASFTAYGADGFGLREQHRLAVEASAAASRGARVVVSNSDTPMTRALYSGWELTELQVKRTISAAGGSRGKVGELLLALGG